MANLKGTASHHDSRHYHARVWLMIAVAFSVMAFALSFVSLRNQYLQASANAPGPDTYYDDGWNLPQRNIRIPRREQTGIKVTPGGGYAGPNGEDPGN